VCVQVCRLCLCVYRFAGYVCVCTGLPVQVRDQALKIHDEIPKSDVGKEYYQQNLEREVMTVSCQPIHFWCNFSALYSRFLPV